MPHVARPVAPFSHIAVYKRSNDQIEVFAKIDALLCLKKGKIGLALDASRSMKPLYGSFTNPFPNILNVINHIDPMVRDIADRLFPLSNDGLLTLLYWSVGQDGSQLELLGSLTPKELSYHAIGGPNSYPWGRHTRLLPPLKYFVETVFLKATMNIAVFLTDGLIEDIADVKQYCFQLAKEIASGIRSEMKFFLLVVGEQLDESRTDELCDMFSNSDLYTPNGTAIDLWDYASVDGRQTVADLITSGLLIVDPIVATEGQITDNLGRVIRDYSTGLPEFLSFTLSKDATAFTLTYSGNVVTQDLSDLLSEK